MQQILEKLRQVEWWFSSVFVAILCSLIAAVIYAAVFPSPPSGPAPPSDPGPSSVHPQLPNKTPAPGQKRTEAGPAPADDGSVPMQSAPVCPTPQSPAAAGNQTVRQLYCSVMPCYAGELDQTVVLLGEWIGLTEASLKSCNGSDRKLLAADAVFSKLSRMPDSNTGTFEDRQYCSSARYNLVGKIEETMNRLQMLPPTCANKIEEASVPVTAFMRKIRR
ncbi:MAG: hypothetical protein QOD09_2132 [Bradyrhizobium sp.]|jgi:hypothetical protein|nr:hypothetical protein [Bradyrhizobium sp.]MEA2953634.1 hypothetical protein [Alphaproteobacteria bacterium]